MQETILNYEEFPFMIDLRPREFAKANITNDQWFLGLTDEELKILVEGTHDDPYHETWDKLLEVAKFNAMAMSTSCMRINMNMIYTYHLFMIHSYWLITTLGLAVGSSYLTVSKSMIDGQ